MTFNFYCWETQYLLHYICKNQRPDMIHPDTSKKKSKSRRCSREKDGRNRERNFCLRANNGLYVWAFEWRERKDKPILTPTDWKQTKRCCNSSLAAEDHIYSGTSSSLLTVVRIFHHTDIIWVSSLSRFSSAPPLPCFFHTFSHFSPSSVSFCSALFCTAPCTSALCTKPGRSNFCQKLQKREKKDRKDNIETYLFFGDDLIFPDSQ